MCGCAFHLAYICAMKFQTIFYADNTRQVISSVVVDDVKEEEVFWSYGSDEVVSGVTVDWVNNLVLCSTNTSIVAVSMENMQVSTIHSNLDHPRSMVIHSSLEQR